jgi:hypothetical protein
MTGKAIELSKVLEIIANQEAFWEEVKENGTTMNHAFAAAAGKNACKAIRNDIEKIGEVK